MREDDLFGDGLEVGDDYLVKAQLKVRVRPLQLPAAQDIVDKLDTAYAERLVAMNAEIEGVLRTSDSRKSLGLYVVQGGLGDDLFKAAIAKPPAGGAPKQPQGPKTNASGQPRAKAGSGSANYQRPMGGVKNAGSRGGKWYRDDHGNVRYGTKPSTSFHTELTPEQTAEHLKHYRPLPFMGEDFNDKKLGEHIRANAKALGFTSDDCDFLDYWYGGGEALASFKIAFGQEGDPLTDEDLGGDLSQMRFNHPEYTDGQSVTYEEAVVGFLRAQEWGADFDTEVQPALDGLFQRYHKALANPAVLDKLKDSAEAVEKEAYKFFVDAAHSEEAIDKVGEQVMSAANPLALSLNTAAALGAMELIFIPGKGETKQAAQLKGKITPNLSLLDETSGSKGVLLTPEGQKRLNGVSNSQLMMLYIAANLQSTHDGEGHYEVPKVDASTGGTQFPNSKLGDIVLAKLKTSAGLNSTALDVVRRRLDAASAQLAGDLNDANDGHNLGIKDVIKDADTALSSPEELEKLLKKSVDLQKLRVEALEAQKNDSFEMPASMKDGKLGGSLQATALSHQLIDPEHSDKTFDLFRHQKQSLNWMDKVKRGILALDAGMGKTPTVVTFMEKLKAEGKAKTAILFLPPSLMSQWPDEIASYAPGAKDKILNLSGLSLDERKIALQSDIAKNAEYILISTGTLTGSGDDPEEGASHDENDGTGGTDEELSTILKGLDGALFIDECHQGGFKSPDTVRHKIAKDVIGDREYAFGMSATPMPNTPIDVFHLANLFAPDSVGTQEEWEGDLHGVQYDSAKQKWDIANPENIKKLKDRIKPFVFHKLITDPEVVEDMGKALGEKSNSNADIHIAANHPLHDYTKPGGKIDQIVSARIDYLQQERIKNGEEPYGPLVVAKLTKLLAVNLHRQATISPALIDPEYKGPAPKIERMVKDMVDHFKGGGGTEDSPLVVFSTFPKGGFDLLKKEMAKQGIDPTLVGQIDGTKSSRERAFEQDMTNQGKRKILLVGTMSGGAGLNLQKKANKMMFLDEPWHPGAKRQAIGRVWRTGQKKPVLVHNYRVMGTWDERVEDKLAGKQVMTEAMLGNIDPTSPEFADAADKGVEGITGQSTKSKMNKKRERSKVNSLKIASGLKDILGEDFQDVPDNFDDEKDIPDIDHKFDNEYNKYLDAAKNKQLGKDANALSNSLDHNDEWRKWNRTRKEKDAKQAYGVKMMVAQVANESGDHAKAKKAEASAQNLAADYRGYYMEKMAEAQAAKITGKSDVAAAMTKEAAAMKSGFPEAFKGWKEPKLGPIGHEEEKPEKQKPGGKKPPEKAPEKGKAKEKVKEKPPEPPKKIDKKPQRQKEEEATANPFHKKSDPIAHQAHELFNKQKPKDKAEALEMLAKLLKRHSADPEDDAKELLKYMGQNKSHKVK